MLWAQSTTKDDTRAEHKLYHNSKLFISQVVIIPQVILYENNNKILHKILQLMMVYHSIKFGCKKISSSADMVETVISESCDLDLQDSKPVFLHDTREFAGSTNMYSVRQWGPVSLRSVRCTHAITFSNCMGNDMPSITGTNSWLLLKEFVTGQTTVNRLEVSF